MCIFILNREIYILYISRLKTWCSVTTRSLSFVYEVYFVFSLSRAQLHRCQDQRKLAKRGCTSVHPHADVNCLAANSTDRPLNLMQTRLLSRIAFLWPKESAPRNSIYAVAAAYTLRLYLAYCTFRALARASERART